jgi:hypothetical protein
MNYSIKSPTQQSTIPNGAMSSITDDIGNAWNNVFGGGNKKPVEPTKKPEISPNSPVLPKPLDKASVTLCKRKDLEKESFKAVSNTIDNFTSFNPEVEEIKNFSVNLLRFEQMSESYKANINRDIAGINSAVLQINDAKSKKDKCGMLVGFQNYVNNLNQLARDAHDAGGSINLFHPWVMKRAKNIYRF